MAPSVGDHGRGHDEGPHLQRQPPRQLDGGRPVHMVCFRSVVNESGYMAYDLDLSDGTRSWRVQRRYHEILGCHKALSRTGRAPCRQLPPFPGKEPVCQQLFGREIARRCWATDRACQLQAYLDGVLESQAALRVAPVRRLLGLEGDNHSEEGSFCRSSGSAFAGLRVRPLGSSGEIEVDVRVDDEQRQSCGADALHVSVQLWRVGSDALLEDVDAGDDSAQAEEDKICLSFAFPSSSSQATQRVAVGAGSAWRVSATSGQPGAWSEPVELLVRVPPASYAPAVCGAGEESRCAGWRVWRRCTALCVCTVLAVLAGGSLSEFLELPPHPWWDAVVLRQPHPWWALAALCLAIFLWPLLAGRQDPKARQRHEVADRVRQEDARSIPRSVPMRDCDWRDLGPEEVAGLPILDPCFRGFRALALAEEISVTQLLETGEAFMEILQAMGPAMKIGRMDFGNNMRKTRTWYEGDPSGRATLAAFLAAEKATGIHGLGGMLKDPSGAIGTLWMRRTFEFVIAIFEKLIEGATMSDACRSGYVDALERFHGRLLRGTFGMVIRGVPSREAFLRALQVSEETITRSVRALCLVSRPACAKMKALAESLDLEDTRRV